jgi:hypothetical protein
MKMRGNKTSATLTVIFMSALAVGLSLGAPVTPPAGQEIQKSVFILPANPNEGRDPFFPDSTRVYKDVENLQPTHAPEVTSLEIKSIMGAAPRYFAIVNNHTFGAGDEGDVITKDGRLHIRVLKITPTTVLVEVDGQIHELTFSSSQ